MAGIGKTFVSSHPEVGRQGRHLGLEEAVVQEEVVVPQWEAMVPQDQAVEEVLQDLVEAVVEAAQPAVEEVAAHPN